MKKDYILFDLDGTLTDPKEGIVNSVIHALKAFGIHVENPETLCSFIGPPLKDSFMKYYGLDEQQAFRAIGIYREYFTDRGLFENVKYPGIDKVLERLVSNGKKLYVATSKPEVFAKEILEHFHLTAYFQWIGGADLEETRVRKGDVISYVMENCGITEYSRTVMVGDREHDILGAKETGISSVGVLYGYGDRAELEAAGADRIAKDLISLETCLLEPWP